MITFYYVGATTIIQWYQAITGGRTDVRTLNALRPNRKHNSRHTYQIVNACALACVRIRRKVIGFYGANAQNMCSQGVCRSVPDGAAKSLLCMFTISTPEENMDAGRAVTLNYIAKGVLLGFLRTSMWYVCDRIRAHGRNVRLGVKCPASICADT